MGRMLTDIFANRYAGRRIWNTFGAAERALLVQCFRNVAEQVMPYWHQGKPNESTKKLWDSVERRLSMELGLEELSPRAYGYYNPQKFWISGTYSTEMVCRSWMLADISEGSDPDSFMKERLSFIELAFRERDGTLSRERLTYELLGKRGLSHVNIEQAAQRSHEMLRASFTAYCNELNERFRLARAPVSYHNGFIQLTTDEKLELEVVQPFWKLVADKPWENVSIDMAEAVDRRDTEGRDPAFYAAKALESVIKIISEQKGWTRGHERGAANYIDNLVSERNGRRYIDVWEKDLLAAFFAKVRNQLGHGPGGEPMPNLSNQQTDWAIANSMSWCKSLIERL
ncbi:AbiJ-NTD4 domain-containing protein [Zeimonas arvi]|nr:hypothetical protein [Zeimonas arvi]